MLRRRIIATNTAFFQPLRFGIELNMKRKESKLHLTPCHMMFIHSRLRGPAPAPPTTNPLLITSYFMRQIP